MKAGDKVYYTSPNGTKENGIVKSVNESGTFAFVTYHCNNEWDNYYNYTGVSTNIKDLTEGWVDDDPRDNPLIGEDDSWVNDIDMGAK